MRRYTLYNIYKATRTLLLAAGLLLAGRGVAWGQEDRINEDVTPNSEITEILYVVPGEPKTIEFQTNDASDKLDGYIRWYVESADGTRSITGLTEKMNLMNILMVLLGIGVQQITKTTLRMHVL